MLRGTVGDVARPGLPSPSMISGLCVGAQLSRRGGGLLSAAQLSSGLSDSDKPWWYGLREGRIRMEAARSYLLPNGELRQVPCFVVDGREKILQLHIPQAVVVKALAGADGNTAYVEPAEDPMNNWGYRREIYVDLDDSARRAFEALVKPLEGAFKKYLLQNWEMYDRFKATIEADILAHPEAPLQELLSRRMLRCGSPQISPTLEKLSDIAGGSVSDYIYLYNQMFTLFKTTKKFEKIKFPSPFYLKRYEETGAGPLAKMKIFDEKGNLVPETKINPLEVGDVVSVHAHVKPHVGSGGACLMLLMKKVHIIRRK
eukprot:comp23084_c1_seq2/m.37048 comp23084_c1_seq2/g.37048  ORF comp23084_c1_seq2/g.37048 comp23084_c1_seq2/m.37048 type:complete len:315 (-) comp23084_c1_seq2:637-1581(-)